VDVGIVGGSAAVVDGFSGVRAEQMERGLGSARKAVQKQFIPAALMICTGVLCAPCYFLYAVLLGPICRPFSVLLFKIFECLGCVTILPDGTLEFRNCFGEVTCGWIVRHATQCLIAPGMTTPGRSIIGSFINTTALLWFWCYLLFELYWSWNLMCDSATPDASADLSSAFQWLQVLAPSPVHWLILIFAVSGFLITIAHFVSDMFTSPRAPPRSEYEVHKWKIYRQMRICINLFVFALFCTWGSLLFYFTYTQQQCASSSPSIHRVALLLLLVFFVIVALALLLAACVCIDCCVSGRMRLVLLLSDESTISAPDREVQRKTMAGYDNPTHFGSDVPQPSRATTLFTKTGTVNKYGLQV